MSIVHSALELVKPQFRLHLQHGWHGISHWPRVWVNARFLCQELGVDSTVPCWFAYLHDSQRYDEGTDGEHGARAATWALKLRSEKKLVLTDDQFDDLHQAMTHHSDGHTRAPLVQQICWDADRLDLGRVGVMPDPRYLCTELAKQGDVIRAAYARSVGQRARH